MKIFSWYGNICRGIIIVRSELPGIASHPGVVNIANIPNIEMSAWEKSAPRYCHKRLSEWFNICVLISLTTPFQSAIKHFSFLVKEENLN